MAPVWCNCSIGAAVFDSGSLPESADRLRHFTSDSSSALVFNMRANGDRSAAVIFRAEIDDILGEEPRAAEVDDFKIKAPRSVLLIPLLRSGVTFSVEL